MKWADLNRHSLLRIYVEAARLNVAEYGAATGFSGA